jgi:putative FmdB family regulatory protein
MPLYDYDCAACGRRFEVVHGVQAEGPTVCPICGRGPIRKTISAAAVHFKGSGWAKKERHTTATSGASKTSGDARPAEGGATTRDASESSSSGSGSSADASSTATTAVKPADAGAAAATD